MTALRVIEEQPFNASTQAAALAGMLTSTESFYVRDHFARPNLDAARWHLSVGGACTRTLSLSLAELKKFPKRSFAVTLECAGNGRSRMRPTPPGTPWDDGAVGTATFTGTPLAGILAACGVEAGALEVVFRGADRGVEGGREVAYERSLTVEDAHHPDVLVAWDMNDAPLTREHGAPARLVVPGWYGMASVKWLTSVAVVTEPFTGWFQRERYVRRRSVGEPGIPLSRIRVRSRIVEPLDGARLAARRDVIVEGKAWSGEAPVEDVQVSADGGRTWHAAEVDVARSPHAWRPFAWRWRDPLPGEHTLLSRARDESGAIQPLEAPWNVHGYEQNAVLPVRLFVG